MLKGNDKRIKWPMAEINEDLLERKPFAKRKWSMAKLITDQMLENEVAKGKIGEDEVA